MILIGLTGTHGAGKGTVVEYLAKEKGFMHCSVSEFMADEIRRRGDTPDRPARSALADEYRSHGPIALMEAVFQNSMTSGSERIVLEPQYTQAEVQFIKNRGGTELAVDADLRVRYERVVGRGSLKDTMTFEEFTAYQAMEMQSDNPNDQNLAAAIALADFTIYNNSTLEELHAQIEDVLKKIGIE